MICCLLCTKHECCCNKFLIMKFYVDRATKFNLNVFAMPSFQHLLYVVFSPQFCAEVFQISACVIQEHTRAWKTTTSVTKQEIHLDFLKSFWEFLKLKVNMILSHHLKGNILPLSQGREYKHF